MLYIKLKITKTIWKIKSTSQHNLQKIGNKPKIHISYIYNLNIHYKKCTYYIDKNITNSKINSCIARVIDQYNLLSFLYFNNS